MAIGAVWSASTWDDFSWEDGTWGDGEQVVVPTIVTMSHTPAQVIAQLIVDLGLGRNPHHRSPLPWSTYYGGEPASPDEVITVRLTAGLSEGTIQWNGENEERYGIQVRVRSVNEDSGWIKINQIAANLHAVNIRTVTLDGVDYSVQCVEQRGGVYSLGKAEPSTSRSIHVVNFLTVIDPE